MLYTGTLQTKKDRPNYFIVIAYYEGGSRKQKWLSTDVSIKGNNKRKAEARLKEVLSDYNSQGIDLNSLRDMLFTDYLSRWLVDMKPSVEASTYDGYSLIVNRHIVPYFSKHILRVKDVTPSHIQQYINQKLETLSPNTVRKHLINIAQCFDKALRDNIIPFNPAKRVDKPKTVRFDGAKFYTEAQITKLLDVIKGDTLETLFIITLFYGLRRSEVLGLKWNSVNFSEKTIEIKHTVVKIDKVVLKKDSTKNKSSHRVFPMSEIVCDKLTALKSRQEAIKQLQPNDYVDEGYVFTSICGKKVYDPNYVSKHFKYVLKKNNLPDIRFHDLRHSSASYLLSLGFNLKQIQVWLGHGDIGTTMNVYAHLDMTAKEEISNTLDRKFGDLQASNGAR